MLAAASPTRTTLRKPPMRLALDRSHLLAATHRPRRRLAAVARAEARRRLARDRHRRQVPRRAGRRCSGGSRSAAGYAGPAVAGGKVYVTDRVLDDGAADPDERLRQGEQSAAASGSSASTRRPARSSGSTSTRSSTRSATRPGRGARRPWTATGSTPSARWATCSASTPTTGKVGLGEELPQGLRGRRCRSGASPRTRSSTATSSSAWSAGEGPARGRVRQEDRQGAVGGAELRPATSGTARR